MYVICQLILYRKHVIEIFNHLLIDGGHFILITVMSVYKSMVIVFLVASLLPAEAYYINKIKCNQFIFRRTICDMVLTLLLRI